MRFLSDAIDLSGAVAAIRLATRVVVLSLLTTGCSRPVDESRIVAASANRQSGTLDVSLSLQFSGTQLAALDHGIPLLLEFVIKPEGAAMQLARIQLSYLPMAKRYQLLADNIPARHFSSRLQLLAAIDQARLPLRSSNTSKGTVYMRLDSSALPAPLRLPALFDPEWHLRSAAVDWTTSP